ncbi:metal tolerance protein C2 isoform X2 [Euphorbia lathyris]|uniref:metal tolerance protein C2 isoform X2 n=1 Tax=Euphorbia lathyris TaxID=212925 RepID=UPI003313170F
MENSNSFKNHMQGSDRHQPWTGDFGFGASDRRYAYSRQSSFQQSGEPHTPISIVPDETTRPMLLRTVSNIDMPPEIYKFDFEDSFYEIKDSTKGHKNLAVLSSLVSIFNAARSGNKQMKRLLMMISLNVAYSTAELGIGLLTGRAGLVSDAFHLTFGCGLLTFSLFAMAISRKKPDRVYTYGYERLEVLAAFTNALFLLFMSFSLAVEALHAFIQEESEHKHYLIVSAVTDLLVNLIGVWFFRNYARINLVYRKAEDMNYHSVFLHVVADSIRSAGLILASWFMSLGYVASLFIFNYNCT